MADKVNEIEKLKYVSSAATYNLGGRPKAFATQQQLHDACQAYLTDAKDRHAPLTLSGLAAYLGKSRETVNEFARGNYDTEENKFSDTLKQIKSIIEQDKIEKSLLGLYNPTIAIFDLKNNHNHKDVQEVDNRYVDKDGEDLCAEDLKILADFANRIKGIKND